MLTLYTNPPKMCGPKQLAGRTFYLSGVMYSRFTHGRVLPQARTRVGRLSVCLELIAWRVHDKVASAADSWKCRSELRVETFSRAKHPKPVRSLGM